MQLMWYVYLFQHYKFESIVDGKSEGKPGYNSKRESNQISNSQTKLGKTLRQWRPIPQARIAVAADYDPAVEAWGPIPPLRTAAAIHRTWTRRTDVQSRS
jgi:hypothetical protein